MQSILHVYGHGYMLNSSSTSEFWSGSLLISDTDFSYRFFPALRSAGSNANFMETHNAVSFSWKGEITRSRPFVRFAKVRNYKLETARSVENAKLNRVNLSNYIFTIIKLHLQSVDNLISGRH